MRVWSSISVLFFTFLYTRITCREIQKCVRNSDIIFLGKVLEEKIVLNSTRNHICELKLVPKLTLKGESLLNLSKISDLWETKSSIDHKFPQIVLEVEFSSFLLEKCGKEFRKTQTYIFFIKVLRKKSFIEKENGHMTYRTHCQPLLLNLKLLKEVDYIIKGWYSLELI